uniref:Uncharacterized protein n=1 Tax=Kalanchoe fedtschenkoi TaxID=63787 RepID=A0A7N0TNQ2_KALFE
MYILLSFIFVLKPSTASLLTMPHYACLFLLLVLCALEECNGSSEEVALKPVATTEHYPVGQFMGFKPRRFSAPASAPSRKHNQIGFQAWQSP